MSRRAALRAPLVAAILVGSGLAPTLAADEPRLRFEKTVEFTPDSATTLEAQVGPVRVASVRFSTGSPEGGSLLGKIRRSGDPDTTAGVRASFAAENPQDEEWVVIFTVELLDRKGALIDRFSKSAGLEGEAKTVEADHRILAYALPFVARARVVLEARLD